VQVKFRFSYPDRLSHLRIAPYSRAAKLFLLDDIAHSLERFVLSQRFAGSTDLIEAAKVRCASRSTGRCLTFVDGG
jgi:hypothetical protein